jgi:hypothetical protein
MYLFGQQLEHLPVGNLSLFIGILFSSDHFLGIRQFHKWLNQQLTDTTLMYVKNALGYCNVHWGNPNTMGTSGLDALSDAVTPLHFVWLYFILSIHGKHYKVPLHHWIFPDRFRSVAYCITYRAQIILWNGNITIYCLAISRIVSVVNTYVDDYHLKH